MGQCKQVDIYVQVCERGVFVGRCKQVALICSVGGRDRFMEPGREMDSRVQTVSRGENGSWCTQHDNK